MGRSWKIGAAFGIGLYVHWTFLLLPATTFLVTSWEMGPRVAAYTVLVVLALFGCVLLHELGHALAARGFGVPTRDVTLFPIGGLARLTRMPERPLEEFWIAVAGPAVNVVIATILLPLAFAMGASPAMESLQYDGLAAFLRDLGYLNVVLVMFNMIPAFPMDGGRVLRAILSAGFGRLAATEVAAAVGGVLSILFFVFGLYSTLNHHNGLTFMVLAPVVTLLGQMELAAVRRQAHVRAEPLQVLPADADVVDVTALPAKPDFTGFTWDGTQSRWVEWQNGRPVRVASGVRNQESGARSQEPGGRGQESEVSNQSLA